MMAVADEQHTTDKVPAASTSTAAAATPEKEDKEATHSDDATEPSMKQQQQQQDFNKEKAKQDVAPISKLLSLARPEAPMLVVALVLMLMAEATGMLNPLILASAYNDLVDPTLSQDERMSGINRTMILVLLVHFGGVAVAFSRTTIMGMAGERVVARTRNNLYRSILKQEIAFFDNHQSGELVSRLGSDTQLLSEGTSKALPEVLIGIIKVITSIAIMFWISPKLAGVMIGFVTFIMTICIPFGKILGRLSKKYQDKLGEAQNYSTEALGAMRTVQSFAAEAREEERYQTKIGNPEQYPCWWPADHKTHATTYSFGIFKSLVQSGFFTVIFGVGFGSMYISLW